MIKKAIKIFFIVLAQFILFFPNTCIKAENTAEFQVETAKQLKNNMISVSISVKEITNLGGIDAQIYYDANRVEYINCEVGEAFEDGFWDIFNDEKKASIHCVSIYTKPKNATGELITITFRLKEGVSYQPEFVILDLLDNSPQMNSIPHCIVYQQRDKTWSDTPDRSGLEIEEGNDKADRPDLQNPEDETPKPENETQNAESGTPKPENETQNAESETPKPENETQNVEGGTQKSEDETQKLESDFEESEKNPMNTEVFEKGTEYGSDLKNKKPEINNSQLVGNTVMIIGGIMIVVIVLIAEWRKRK